MATSGAAGQSELSYFDHVADSWGGRYQAHTTGGQALRERRDRALSMLGRGTGKLLDVGCGSGQLAREVVNRGMEYHGVDASHSMIRAGRDAHDEGFTASVALAEALPYRHTTFDSVLCLGVIGAVDDAEAAVAEMRRVLRPGGTMLISFANLASPYAFWKGRVLYPVVGFIRGFRRIVLRRPAGVHRSEQVALFSTRSSAQLLARHRMTVRRVSYFHFNLVLSPLDDLLGSAAARLAERLEGLATTPFRWMGAGFIAEATAQD